MPYFSIIMPTYNRAGIITEAIESIYSQTFHDWELIIIDDHSNDNTKEIIDNLNDQRITYYYLDNNLGAGGARDYGIKRAKGEYIAIADTDDINLPNRLELSYNEFSKDPQLDIVYGLVIRIEKDGTKFCRPSHEFDAELLKHYDYIANPTTAFKKEIYLKHACYDHSIRTGEDYDFWLSCLEKNAKFKFINQPLVMQKIHEESTLLGTSLEKRRENLAYIRKKHNIKTPDFNEVKKLVKNRELLNFVSTPGAVDFWFN